MTKWSTFLLSRIVPLLVGLWFFHLVFILHDSVVETTTNNKLRLIGPHKPAKPLCEECLRIVRQAQRVDLSFVPLDDTDIPMTKEVANETALRNNPPPFSMQSDRLDEACAKHDNTYRMLTKRVRVVPKPPTTDTPTIARSGSNDSKGAKILCIVYTIQQHHDRIPAIRETWAPRCDGFFVASNYTDVALGTVNIPHVGPEVYNNIWQKIRSIWTYVYRNYYTKYDFFHIGGDDLYLIVDNLRDYLNSEEIRTAANGGVFLPSPAEEENTDRPQTPLFLGRRFAYQGHMDQIFNSGGSGYTLNQAALKTLVVQGLPKYFPKARTFAEDVEVAKVLNFFGVLPYETKDEDGGERYMPFMPGHHWGYRLPKSKLSDWYATYSINIKEGPEHCSPSSVAFHYVRGIDMYRIHALLYDLCQN